MIIDNATLIKESFTHHCTLCIIQFIATYFLLTAAPVMNKMPKISPKQKKFCDLIISGENNRQSAIKAGYAEASAHTTANRLLKDKKVVAFLSQHMTKASKKTGINAEYVLTTIQETMEKCKQLVVSDKVDSSGNPVMTYLDIPGILRSSEQLGRSLALFQDQTLHRHTGLETMSDADLDRELAKAAQTRDLAATQDFSEVH